MIDRIILGDNQFFGINHMSEEKGRSLAIRFRDMEAILRVIDTACECGVRAFMFNTHDRVEKICDHFRAHPNRYADLHLYPSMPYAHKYANAVHEKGLVEALNAFVFSGRSVSQIASAVIRGSMTVINKDMTEVMKLLVDAEMRAFRGLNVPAVFLQNIVTDLLLGFGAKEVFVEFANHVRRVYGAEPAFNTMNMPALVDFLLDCGFENPIVCSSINKTGFLMTPNQRACEKTLAEKSFRCMAMSILASGAIAPRDAIAYVCGLPNVQSIVFGASSKGHIEQTCEMISSHWSMDACEASPAMAS
jgi:hypothetical protein